MYDGYLERLATVQGAGFTWDELKILVALMNGEPLVFSKDSGKVANLMGSVEYWLDKRQKPYPKKSAVEVLHGKLSTLPFHTVGALSVWTRLYWTHKSMIPKKIQRAKRVFYGNQQEKEDVTSEGIRHCIRRNYVWLAGEKNAVKLMKYLDNCGLTKATCTFTEVVWDYLQDCYATECWDYWASLQPTVVAAQV